MTDQVGSDDCLDWFKSSFSVETYCVEVAINKSRVQVRDSKEISDFDAPVLSFTLDEWEAFLSGVKAGEFDL